MSYSLGEIAKISGAKLQGSPEKNIERVSSLATAGPSDITFLANRRYVRQLKSTRAGAVILSDEYASQCPVDMLVSDDPYLAFARVLGHMNPPARYSPVIHSSAIVDDSADISATAHIGANVCIEKNVRIDKDVYIGPGCYIGEQVTIGENTRLTANVSLCHGVQLGRNGILHPGAVIGADGFGIVQDDNKWLKIPQIGRVIIGDDVEIGANTTIDRGAISDTVIEDGVKLDNQVQIGHGVRVGENSAIAGCAAIAGSTSIGKRCMIGGMSAIGGHIEIADDVIITGMSGVSNSIKCAGVYSSGIPVTDTVKWRKNIARFRNLDEIARRLKQLEDDVARKNRSA